MGEVLLRGAILAVEIEIVWVGKIYCIMSELGKGCLYIYLSSH